MNTPQRTTQLRELLTQLHGSHNALIRTAVRLALTELDHADLADDPNPHYEQINRLLDAALNPQDDDTHT